jgi:hypothetical protein
MNALLQVAVNAHGGLERWNQLKRLKASVSITSAIWQLKGKPDVQEREKRLRVGINATARACRSTRVKYE